MQKVQKPRQSHELSVSAGSADESGRGRGPAREAGETFNKRPETRQTGGQWETKPVHPPGRYWLSEELEGNQPSSPSRDQEGRDFLLLIRQQNLRESTCLVCSRHSPTQTTQSEYCSATCCCCGPKLTKSQCLSLFPLPPQVF